MKASCYKPDEPSTTSNRMNVAGWRVGCVEADQPADFGFCIIPAEPSGITVAPRP